MILSNDVTTLTNNFNDLSTNLITNYNLIVKYSDTSLDKLDLSNLNAVDISISNNLDVSNTIYANNIVIKDGKDFVFKNKDTSLNNVDISKLIVVDISSTNLNVSGDLVSRVTEDIKLHINNMVSVHADYFFLDLVDNPPMTVMNYGTALRALDLANITFKNYFDGSFGNVDISKLNVQDISITNNLEVVNTISAQTIFVKGQNIEEVARTPRPKR